MARVFSAVDIEDETLLDELATIRDRLDLGFNPVEREKLHVTLQFFQDIDETEIEKVKQGLESIEKDGFQTEVKGVGAFPSREYIRVVWAGMEEDGMRELFAEASTHPVNDDSDHDFMPHITFLRVKNLSSEKKRKLQKQLDEFEDHYFGDLEVDRVKLFKSHLTGDGPEYEKIHEKEL